MRAPAVLLAIPLSIGCALGLICTSTGAVAGVGGQSADEFAACAAAAALVALIGCVGALTADPEGALESTVCVVVGGLLVGLSLGVDASVRAYRSPLYVWFAASDPVARPVMIRGSLREDATLTATGVSLVLDVREIEQCVPDGPAASRPFTIHGLTPTVASRPFTIHGLTPMAAPRQVTIHGLTPTAGARQVSPGRPVTVPPEFTIHGLTPSCATRGGVRLSVAGTLAPGAMGEWRKGRHLRVAASLREPTTYRNPGVPDEQRALARRGIALVGSVKSAAMVEVVAPGSHRDEWASSFRAWVRSVLSEAVGPWSARSAGVAAAIAIGDRTGLTQDDEERLQAAGTYHVIAISGGNIAILTLLLVGAARWLGASPRIAAAVTIVVLLAYSQVTGPAPSVDRAISAAVLFLAGRLIELRGPSINILAVAATLGLSLSPTAVFDPGFLLSFGATLGILIGVPKLTSALTSPGDTDEPAEHSHTSPRAARSLRTRMRRRLGSTLFLVRRLAIAVVTIVAATAAAEVVLAPIGAALFGRLTSAGLILNLAAIPLMTVVQAGSLAALGAWLVDPEWARACGYLVHLAARGLIDSARLVDVAPWLAREVPPPAWGVLAAYYTALILSLLPARASRGAAAVTAVLGLVIVVAPHAATRDGVALPPRGWLRIVFLDVGQGDATLLVLPDRRAFLVDAAGLPAAPLQDPTDGPAFDIGARVVSRTLRAFGVRTLDTFVLTHADADHIGGARSVLRSFRPRAIWEGVPVPPYAPLRWLAETADYIGAEWRTVQAGDRLRLGAVDIHVLHPPPPDWERQRVRNDDAVVLAVRLGNVVVILPGDIGREGERHTLDHLPRFEPTPITVLKAPHHGSATSSTREFLERLQPAAVVFSNGRDNRFGHPAPVVVERYRAMGTTMFSTAEDGAVILDTNGERVEIRTWGGKRMQLGTIKNTH